MEHEKDLFILTGEELEHLKIIAIDLMGRLPNEPMTALLTITYLKELMEQTIGKKALGIVVK